MLDGRFEHPTRNAEPVMDTPESLRKALGERNFADWATFVSKAGKKKIGEILSEGMVNSLPRENIIDRIRLVLEEEPLPATASEFHSIPINRLAAFIAEREIGFLYAMAQHLREEQTCKSSPGLSRVWVQNGNSREPNEGHVAMHGQLVSSGQPFQNPHTGRRIMYPRDPEADLNETLECSCNVVLYRSLYGPLETFIGKPTGRNLNAKSALDYDPATPRPTKEQIAEYQIKVVDILRQNPGLTQMELYKRFKAEEKEKVGYAISALRHDNKIRREKRGRTFAMWLN